MKNTILVFSVFLTLHCNAYIFAQTCDPCVSYYNGNDYSGRNNASNIIADPTGNLYVTGYVTNLSSLADFGTVKYDPSLSETSAIITDYGAQMDFAEQVVRDNNGNIIVTGYSSYGQNSTFNSNSDWLTISYSSDLQSINWMNVYHTGTPCIAHSLAVDANNNVFVTGAITNSGGRVSVATIKYSAQGSLIWESQYAGEYGLGGSGYKIAVDNHGYAYVTGDEKVNTQKYRIVIIKYDNTNNINNQILWIRSYESSGNGYDFGADIKVEDTYWRNIYVTGQSFELEGSSSVGYMTTMKFNPDGTRMWIVQKRSAIGTLNPAAGYSIALYVRPCSFDAPCWRTNVFIAGSSDQNIGQDIDMTLWKFDEDGNQLWDRYLNGSSNLGDAANSIQVDAAGNSYITGSAFNNGVKQFTCRKYDLAGNTELTKFWSPASGGNADANSNAIFTGSNYFGIYIAGTAWNQQRNNYDLVTVAFTSAFIPLPSDAESDLNTAFVQSADTAYIAGSDGLILRTSNRGISWDSVKTNTHADINVISFLNRSIGIALSDSGKVLYTTNGGANWQTRQLSVTTKLNSLIFFGNNLGVIVGDNGKIFRTTNSGNNWTQMQSTVSGSLKHVLFSDASNGIAIGDNGTILKTENGGETWTSLTRFTTRILKSIQKISQSEIIIAGDSGSVFYSSNNGANWINRSISTALNFNSICFVNSNTGYIGGDGGMLLYTTDKGSDWFSLRSFTIKDIKSIATFGSNYVIITGSHGLLLKSFVGSGSENRFAANEFGYVNEYTENYSLFQNFPNPFNPLTKIKFCITKPVNVKIYVYDILGSIVSILIDMKMEVGEHMVDFDGSNLASGVYFYKIEAGKFNQVKKMVLLK